jgi:putative hydrolase of the HAD superfamily
VTSSSWPGVLLVDLDNTLHDYNGAAHTAREQMAAGMEAEFGVTRASILVRYMELMADDAAPPATSARELRLERMRRLLATWPQTRAGDAGRWADILSQALLDRVAPFPGVVETLRELQGERRVVILTEGYEDMQSAIAARLGLPLGPGQMLVTRSCGVRKVDGSAYRLAVERLGVAPQDAVMIGDNWDWDILAASREGLWQLWVNATSADRGAPPQRYLGRVQRFPEVPDLLVRGRGK